MLLLSHAEPIFAGIDHAVDAASSALSEPAGSGSLAQAFAEFVGVSSRLEDSYRELQAEVARLGYELAERNAALRRSMDENERMRRSLEQIVASMPSGVLVLNACGGVALMNPEAASLLGIAPEGAHSIEQIGESIGIPIARLSQVEGAQEFRLGQPPRWIEMRVRHIGSTGHNDVELTILVLCNVTQHRLAEQQRESARRAHALAEIAATLAHEIRNPLASLELFSSLLAEDSTQTAGSRSTEWIHHLRAGIRSLSATVNNVLSFHGSSPMRRTRLHLAPAVREAMAFAMPVAAEAGVALSFATDTEDVEIDGNREAIFQAVLNLLMNAVRHTPAGGRCAVSVAASGPDGVVIGVRDNGCGIAAEDLPSLFRAGFSGSGASSGLGLAVCAQVAAAHRGRMAVESVLGEGAHFSMELQRI